MIINIMNTSKLSVYFFALVKLLVKSKKMAIKKTKSYQKSNEIFSEQLFVLYKNTKIILETL